ncbi:BBE domain-containing protein [Streptomyces rectiverticillatus]|uniref:BBE domain-containing protein n=1 Tax=Streptomyces rectiverticillatus TaxID=173860 RepID=UPI003CCD549E
MRHPHGRAVPPHRQHARGPAPRADAGFHAVDPHSNGETYQNFIDPSLRDWRHAYYAENYARLSSVKAEYDRHGAFRFPQGIDPAPAPRGG